MTRRPPMLLRGHLAKLMVQVNPQLYCKFVIYNKNNQALLYVKLSMATHVLLRRVLLYCRKFVSNLHDYKTPFVINPYDPCIARVMINKA
jgi:hypothetical protein